ncbi:hypothetical protein L228DRAFT_280969 [Xylona heveae TC161]|uniref:KOW domain-containing protein n=1 Tax=Xylona heveae (strain CBS 132557 / TC161) TaxID=1328760 RepID=A0A165J5E1_XYLHT|nr:hypothetical protein L228DRAFT_280969 [Xylona heveae TC161]KZF25752.1 hypothetical protein L228DRAFT_280969 [Xylona heveae TC161]
MQKVIRRTALAKTQHARKAARRADKNVAINRKISRQNDNVIYKGVFDDIRTARQVRRENWELGPLAPRRDVGDAKETYGTIDARRLQTQKKQKESTLMLFAAGDRVVLTEGRDQGKIGSVREVRAATNELVVSGLNLVDVAVPAFMILQDNDKRPIRAVEQPVSALSVKLVYPLPDPESGEPKDVIIKKLVRGRVWHNRQTGDKSWSRYVPGLGVKVPWPEKGPEPMEEEHDADTLRMDVEAQTWVPTLLRPPMPSTVIDELRNKYSVFRDRHDDEYIERKMAEDRANEEKKRAADLMRSPVKELNRLEREAKKKNGKPRLTSEMLEKIGEIMAKKQGIDPASPAA